MTEVPPTTLRLHGAAGAPAIAAATVRAAGETVGLDAEAAERLAQATSIVIGEVLDRGFEDSDEPVVDVTVGEEYDAVVVRVDDVGLPFALSGDRSITALLESKLVDEIHQLARGADGNRTEIVVHHANEGADIRTNADVAEHHNAHASPEVDADAQIEVRSMAEHDAEGVARLTWRTYGYTFQHHEFYRPDLIVDLLAAGTLQSWVGVTDEGEVVGHTACMCRTPGQLVVEGGRAMVDPRYRGHHVMQHLRSLREQWANERGYFGMFSTAVTAHTRSQRLGGGPETPVTGLLLGTLPPTVSFRRMVTTATPRRQALVMAYTKFRDHPEITVHPPEVDRAWIERIYEANELPRRFGAATHPAPSATTRLEAHVHPDVGTAALDVLEVGADAHEVLMHQLRQLHATGIEVVFADVALADPAAPTIADALTKAGFSFGGIIPLVRGADGDVIRYQHAGLLDVVPEEIEIVSDLGKELLQYVLDRREAVS